MPTLIPFRALRYDAASTDLSAVLAPPYDIISPAQRQDLLAQDPHNIVRIELPADLGSAGEADYAGAAQTAADWRRDGVLVKDAEPTVTVHQMRWTDAEGASRSSAGLLVRLGLEEYGPDAGVLPHERTHGGPKEDRYALLDATQLNTSPLVFLAGSDPAATSAAIMALIDRAPDAAATTGDGVEHRLWVVAADDAGAVLELMSSAPITIADGHHRYETALRYRADHAAGGEPASDYVMALIYPVDEAPPVLPTHRVLSGQPSGEDLLERLQPLGSLESLEDGDALLARMSAPVEFAPGVSGTGHIGVYSAGHAAILTVDPGALDGAFGPGLSEASMGLDVNALSAVIDSVFGADGAALAAEGRLWYVKDAREAVQQVRDRDAATVFLLDIMPIAAISAVAEAGEVMPQKSTYFDPKAPTGLVLNPLEW